MDDRLEIARLASLNERQELQTERLLAEGRQLAAHLDAALEQVASGAPATWALETARVAHGTLPSSVTRACEQLTLIASMLGRALELPGSAEELKRRAADLRQLAMTVENVARMVELIDAVDGQERR